MRNIKFRAWNPQSKKMMNDVNILVCNDQCHGIDENGLDWSFDFCKPELMQFTGLQDKSSTAIYEGDIVEPMDKYSDWLAKGYVVFERGSFVIESLNPFFTKPHDQLTAYSNKYKVIGNIHENKELLESNNAK